LVVALVLLLLWTFRKTHPTQSLHRYQWPLRIWLLVFMVLIINHRHAIAHQLNRTLHLSGKAQPIAFYEWNGFLFSSLYLSLQRKPITEPPGYRPSTIAQIVQAHQQTISEVSEKHPDVIIFFIEAFADPRHMSVATNQDPIPNFRRLAASHLSGMVVSPEMGGRSANPEFELLSGLSMRFMPNKAVPYMDHLDRPIPALAREFKRHGYQTTAWHVASLDFFNYNKVYPMMGFDHKRTLWQQPGVELDVAGRYPSDMALVRAIIDTTENSDQPQFIFSFANATHGFWTYDAYDDGPIEVTGDYVGGGQATLNTYLNALHTADQAIGQLIAHYQQSEQPTVILVMGDHQPSLPEFRQHLVVEHFNQHKPGKTVRSQKQLKRFFTRQLKYMDPEDPLAQGLYLQSHQVPYLIWRNFASAHRAEDSAMYLLGSQLLSAAQLQKSPLYNLLSAIDEQLPVIHKRSVLRAQDVPLMQAYELLQYDIMAGEQHCRSSSPEMLNLNVSGEQHADQ